MKKYVALLRGINVGGNNKVEMSGLGRLFESLGFSNVSTYINSGNVIFESDGKDEDALLKKVETGLERSFGLPIKAVIRDARNIRAVCRAIPPDWKNDADGRTDILFLRDEFDDRKTLDLIPSNREVDTLAYVPGAILWHLDRKHYNRTGMRKLIGTTVYRNMTMRNVNTVRKLSELMG